MPSRRKASGNRSGNASVRIISGLFRGRNLQFPDIEGLRPSLGRTRETLFNWLQPHIAGSRCLDLFAGSGALGFEALSRGAAHATLIEQDASACASLRRNAAMLGLEPNQCQILCADAHQFLRDATGPVAQPRAGPFDLVFLDPPFAAGALPELLARLQGSALLAKHALIYYEGAAGLALDQAGFDTYRSKASGNYQYGLLTPSVSS